MGKGVINCIMTALYSRWQKQTIQEAIKTRRVLLLCGARQCGKTTLAKQIAANNGKYELFHYRDREQRKIDFLIERDDQVLLGIEVKAGSAISSNDFKHLKWFRDNIAKNRPFLGIVLYSGELAGSMGDNLWAVPFGSLWS